MPYKCVHGGVTRPCIYDPECDPNLSPEGRKLAKKRYRTVRKNDILDFVCPISRKWFIAIDDATKKQDEKDLARINAKLKALGVDVPKDALVWESAANLSAINMVERKKKERKPTRTFQRQKAPVSDKAPEESLDDTVTKSGGQAEHKEEAFQKKELRDWIRTNGGQCTNFDGLPKLKQIKKNIQRDLDKG
jgi:hypothetical protein